MRPRKDSSVPLRRSARKIETSTVENVDVVVCSKDSMVRCVDFQFDKLEYWLDYVCAGGDADSTDTVDRVKQKHVVVTQGSVKELTSQKQIQTTDSTHQQSVSTISAPRGGREGAFSFWEGMGAVSWGVGSWAFFLCAAIVLLLSVIKRIRLPTS